MMQCVLVYCMKPRSRSTLWVLICRHVASSVDSSSSSGHHRPGCGSGGRGCTATCWGPSSPHTIGHNVCSLGHCASNPEGEKMIPHLLLLHLFPNNLTNAILSTILSNCDILFIIVSAKAKS